MVAVAVAVGVGVGVVVAVAVGVGVVVVVAVAVVVAVGVVVKYVLEFEINFLPKTNNPNSRQHWAVKNQENKMLEKLIWVETLGKIPSRPLSLAKLTLTRYSSCSLDFDNLVASFKHCVDCLVKLKIIENDKYENIGGSEYCWVKTKPKMGKIGIGVEEL